MRFLEDFREINFFLCPKAEKNIPCDVYMAIIGGIPAFSGLKHQYQGILKFFLNECECFFLFFAQDGAFRLTFLSL